MGFGKKQVKRGKQKFSCLPAIQYVKGSGTKDVDALMKRNTDNGDGVWQIDGQADTGVYTSTNGAPGQLRFTCTNIKTGVPGGAVCPITGQVEKFSRDCRPPEQVSLRYYDNNPGSQSGVIDFGTCSFGKELISCAAGRPNITTAQFLPIPY